MARNRPELAADKLAAELRVSPGNHPLTMAYANALMKNQQPHVAEEVLVDQSQLAARWIPVCGTCWRRYRALSGNIVGLHQSRAEYFILNGILDAGRKATELCPQADQG